ncbi:hypothetical protein ACJJI3_01445 [Microbulbifer sp. ZKSA004]|uniref:hypothetical protein n=1 Tax=Microbulbifer sp. ZKSA004 TaxID=3243389 RepID=UPI004039CDC1
MDRLKLAIDVFKCLSDKEIVSRQVSGILPADRFLNFKSELDSAGLLFSSHDEAYKVDFHLPSEPNEVFALSINELLQASKRKLNPPARFYLADEDYLYEGVCPELPEFIRGYLDVSLLARCFLSLADHDVPSIPKAIFLHGEKLELVLKYQQCDLKPLVGLAGFVSEFVNAEIHKDQKITIIKSVLFEMLKSNEIDRFNLASLVGRFSEFLERIHSSYQLYVSEFSFDKVKAQIEHEKFEFTIKLNTVFSSIQNQLLAIPVALVLVGGQMKMSSDVTLKNVSIWLGSIVFALLMSLLIRNQRSNLEAIKLEVDSQWANIKDKHQLVVSQLSLHYGQIQQRYTAQYRFLSVVSFIVAASVVGSTALLLYNSSIFNLFSEVLICGGLGAYVLWLIVKALDFFSIRTV